MPQIMDNVMGLAMWSCLWLRATDHEETVKVIQLVAVWS